MSQHTETIRLSPGCRQYLQPDRWPVQSATEPASLRIADVRPPTPREWDDVWTACPYATYFHSREWAEAWRVYTAAQMSPAARLVAFSDGKSALLPFSVRVRWRGLVTRYYSSPAGTYGGWLSKAGLEAPHHALLVDYLRANYRNIQIRANPFEPSPAVLDSLGTKNRDETQVLRLAGDGEAAMKTWSGSHRRSVRKARREGVCVRQARGRDDWLAYYRIYQDSLRRWGRGATSRYGWRLFDYFAHENSPNVRLWLADAGGQPVAGALVFYARNHAVYWHGAALERFFPLRPVHLLFAEIVCDACERGLTWFDFNPSGGHAGVQQFKRGFSPLALPAPLIRRGERFNAANLVVALKRGGR